MPYICPARSSKRRINSMSRKKPSSSLGDASSSATSTGLPLRVAAISPPLAPAAMRVKSRAEHAGRSPALQPRPVQCLVVKAGIGASWDIARGRFGSVRGCLFHDHQLVRRDEVQRRAHPLVEQIAVEMTRSEIRHFAVNRFAFGLKRRKV